MGVTYKIKPELIEFIINKKKENPNLSCRKFSDLIIGHLKIKVSKSSINAIVKNAGLSMPIGRRPLQPHRPPVKLQLALPNLDLDSVPKLELTKKDESSFLVPLETKPVEQQGVIKGEPVKSLELPAIEVSNITQHNEPDSVTEREPEVLVPPPPVIKEEEQQKLPVPKVDEVKLPDKIEEPTKPLIPKETKIIQPIVQQEVTKERPVEPTSQEAVPVLESVLNNAPETIIGGQTTGAIILKSADFLVGGISRINEIFRSRLSNSSEDLLSKTEALVYANLFDKPPYANLSITSGLWPLISRRFKSAELLSYLNALDGVANLAKDLAPILSDIFKEVRGIKLILTDNQCVYFDGQLRTIWSTPNIPHDFSATLCETKSYVKTYFEENGPFVLSMSPGYDTPTPEFINFVLGCDLKENKNLSSLSLFGEQFVELDSLRLEQNRKRSFIFGLWPWQFVRYRKVNKIKEFKAFNFEPLKTEFHIAEIEVDLLQPDVNKRVTFRGFAVKTNLSEKVRLVVLSNYFPENLTPDICRIYLNHWPNLENTFHDFSRKAELFTYTVNARGSLLTENLNFKDFAVDLNSIFSSYVKGLDLFVKRHFLPTTAATRSFSTIKEQFYDLPVSIKSQNDFYAVTFLAPPGYGCMGDLKYMCLRLNEKEVVSFDGKKYWFSC